MMFLSILTTLHRCSPTSSAGTRAGTRMVLFAAALPLAFGAIAAPTPAIVEPPPSLAKPDVDLDALAAAFSGSLQEGVVDVVGLDRELRRIEPCPVGVLLTILEQGVVPSAEVGGGSALRPAQREVVKRVLRTTPLRVIRRQLDLFRALPAEAQPTHAALWLLGEVGDHHDFRRLLNFAAPPPRGRVPRAVRREFEGALLAILARHPDALSPLADLFDECPASLGSSVVAAVEAQANPATVAILARLLFRVPDLDAVILLALDRRAQRCEPPFDEGIRGPVRRYLGATDERVRLLAISAVGSLEDYEAIGELVDLLPEGTPNQRTAIFEALRKITRCTLRHDVALWERWYDAEAKWWEERAARRFANLDAVDGRAVAYAINEISTRRMYRHELARVLVDTLARDETELAVLACRAIERFGSRTVIRDLIPCLSREPELAAAAHRALVTITGRDLPPDRSLWREAYP